MSTIKVDTVRPVTADASLTLQGDSSGSGVTGLEIGVDPSNNGILISDNLTGLICAFGNSTAPNGWIYCDGSAISRTTYARLFSVISTTWGVGDGSTTFNVPDFRGEFLRGWDDSAGNDPDAASRTGGDAVGSSQGNMIKDHVHWLQSYSGQNSTSGSYNPNNAGYGETGPYGNTIYSRDISDDSTVSNKNFTGGNETRPRNKAVLFCIKF